MGSANRAAIKGKDKKSELKFEADLEEFSRLLDVSVKQIVRLATFKIFTGVVRKTPVDTGIARGSWVIGVGQRAPEFIAAEGAPAPTAVVPDYTNPYSKVIISNYVPYIFDLESGNSIQAPHGMVQLTLNEVIQELRSASLRASS